MKPFITLRIPDTDEDDDDDDPDAFDHEENALYDLTEELGPLLQSALRHPSLPIPGITQEQSYLRSRAQLVVPLLVEGED